MEIDFKPGHIVLKNGKGPIYLVLHAGPRIGATIDRDTDADSIAYLCWKETGGTLVLVTTPRQQEVGIDFNRDHVDARTALKNWKSVQTEGAGRYKNRFAWSAYDMDDYRKKQRMYEEFWSMVRKMGDTFFLVHSAGIRVGHIPTLIDIITFGGKGLKRGVAKRIVDKLNAKYEPFFLGIKILYDKSILLKHEIRLNDVFSKEKSYILEELIQRDLGKIRKYAEPSMVKKLEKHFTPDNLMEAVENALRRAETPKITIENIFSGEKAFGPKKYLIGKAKTVVEIEFTEFMGTHFQKQSAEILQDFVREVSRGSSLKAE